MFELEDTSRGLLCDLNFKSWAEFFCLALNAKQGENPNIHLSGWEQNRRETKPIINRSIDD